MLRTIFLRQRVGSLEVKHRCFSSVAAVKVTEEEVKQFEDDGATVVRQLFSPEWVEELRDIAEVNMKNPGLILLFFAFLRKVVIWTWGCRLG
jgi:hypothetical protein